MERFVKGDVVVLPFPFSDLSLAKRRPALVLSGLLGDDIILCQITSQFVKDDYALELNTSDFAIGSLKKPSNIRPNRLFTADRNIVIRKVGTLNPDLYEQVAIRLCDLIRK
nr:type II toxin-antitoxin system PemK/MazF family toxin [Bacteroidota bacterium]